MRLNRVPRGLEDSKISVSRNPRNFHEKSAQLAADGSIDAALLTSMQGVELLLSAST